MVEIDETELIGQNIQPCTECGTYICCFCQTRSCPNCRKPLCDLCILELKKYRDQCTECASSWSSVARATKEEKVDAHMPRELHFGRPRSFK